MENETEKIFKAQIDKLPSIVVDYISSTDWEELLDGAASVYSLSEREVSVLKREVTLVLAGLAHPDLFRDTLEKEAWVSGETLDAIVKSVEEKIIAPIRPTLVAFFERQVTPVFARNEATQDLDTGYSAQDVNLLIQPRQSTDSQRQGDASLSSPQQTVNGQASDVSPFPLVPNVPSAPPSNVPPVPLVPPSPLAPFRVWEREPDIAPDNLPIAEDVPLLIPPIPPKESVPESASPSHPFEEKMKQVFTAGQQSMGELSIEPPAPTSIVRGQLSNVPPAPAPPHSSFADPYREPIE